jgi:hypothetical protein
MVEKKLIPLPLRIREDDFISEMFLLARIISENLRLLEVEVRGYEIFMLSSQVNCANINIMLENGSNAIVSISSDPLKGGMFVYFFNKQTRKSCSYADFQQKKFLELANMIKN